MKKAFKIFSRKFKKQKKSFKISYLIIGCIYIVCLFGFIFLSKIFSTRYLLDLLIGLVDQALHIKFAGLIVNSIIILLVLYIFYYFLFGAAFMFTKKKKRFIALLIITTIFSIILGYGSTLMIKAYTTLGNSQKRYVTYTSVMMSMNDTKDYETIGMINAKNDPTGYILPKEMIKKEKIDGDIEYYDDYISMMNDLYDGNIDALFITKDYPSMFTSYDKFQNIANETKVVYEYSKKMENMNNVVYSTKNISEPFTILLMGVDSEEGNIDSSSSFNGDSLMLITFNPKTLSATVFSIPRDTYVPIACTGGENKINSSAYGGTSCVVDTIEDLTGIDIDYYLKINFTGVVSLVNDLGGIDIDVPMKFCEQDSLRRFDQYEICLEPGYQHLDGEAALALARHRHSLPLGDFQRVQNQQLVVEAMVKKLKTVKSVDAFYSILEDVTNNIDTNMTTNQMLGFFKIIKNVLNNKLEDSDFISIQRTYLTGYDLYMNISGMGNVYTFQYYKESLDDIVKAMKINLELEDPEPITTFSFSAKEEYEEYVAGKNYSSGSRKTTLPSFVGSNISYLKSWAQSKSIGITVNEVMEGNPQYDASLPDGYILSQSVPAGTDISKIYSINVSVIVKVNEQSSNKTITNEETNNNGNKEDTTPQDNPGGDNPSGDQGGTNPGGEGTNPDGGTTPTTPTNPTNPSTEPTTP